MSKKQSTKKKNKTKNSGKNDKTKIKWIYLCEADAEKPQRKKTKTKRKKKYQDYYVPYSISIKIKSKTKKQINAITLDKTELRQQQKQMYETTEDQKEEIHTHSTWEQFLIHGFVCGFCANNRKLLSLWFVYEIACSVAGKLFLCLSLSFLSFLG